MAIHPNRRHGRRRGVGDPLPPEKAQASGDFAVAFTNLSSSENRLTFSFVVPPPNIQIVGQGVGDFFPAGADPEQDVSGVVEIRIVTRLTRLDGSVEEDVLRDYGMSILRDPVTGHSRRSAWAPRRGWSSASTSLRSTATSACRG